ncbi:MAG: carboxymuconolactone decarboxylase family protein [Bryobacteraceae bacterium]
MTLSPSTQKWAVILLAASASFLGYAQSKLPADLDPQSRARLPYLKSSEVDAKGKKVVDTFGKGGTVTGPLAFATYNPAVGQVLLDLHDAAVTGGTLDAYTRELAILVACRETNYNLEWNGHQASALKAGIDAKLIDVVRKRGPLAGLNEKDATVIRFGREMLTDKKVDSATFAKAVELWGKRGTMDMVAAMSTYAVSGFFAIAVDEHPAEGRPELPAVR